MIPLQETNEDHLSREERASIEEAWGKESERRMAELETGKTDAISSEEVHKSIRSQIKAV